MERGGGLRPTHRRGNVSVTPSTAVVGRRIDERLSRSIASMVAGIGLLIATSCSLVAVSDEPIVSRDGATMACSSHVPIAVDATLASFALISLIYVTTAGGTDDEQARRVYGASAGVVTLAFAYSMYQGIRKIRDCHRAARARARRPGLSLAGFQKHLAG